jgi:hypothetical protein
MTTDEVREEWQAAVGDAAVDPQTLVLFIVPEPRPDGRAEAAYLAPNHLLQGDSQLVLHRVGNELIGQYHAQHKIATSQHPRQGRAARRGTVSPPRAPPRRSVRGRRLRPDRALRRPEGGTPGSRRRWLARLVLRDAARARRQRCSKRPTRGHAIPSSPPLEPTIQRSASSSPSCRRRTRGRLRSGRSARCASTHAPTSSSMAGPSTSSSPPALRASRRGRRVALSSCASSTGGSLRTRACSSSLRGRIGNRRSTAESPRVQSD